MHMRTVLCRPLLCPDPPLHQSYIRGLDVDVAGFTELNGWQDDSGLLAKVQPNYYSLTWLTGQAGLPYAELLHVPSGYHIGG